MTEQPTLTDGVVRLTPFGPDHVEAHVAGEDAVGRLWFGQSEPTTHERMTEVVQRWATEREQGTRLTFAIEHEGRSTGTIEVRPRDDTAHLSWLLYAGERGHGYATRAARLVVDWCLSDRREGGLGAKRVEAAVDARNQASLRVATRAGLLREGVRRVAPGMHDRPDATEVVVLSRLVTDPPLSDPQSFRSLLNSFLPRKRAISQMLIRDPDDRVLLCQLTYKRDWDLPGGVVEVGESPQLAVAREVEEELGLEVRPGALLLTDWLPPWGGWDDALCLVWDGGVHDPGITERIVEQTREIRSAEWADAEQVVQRCADFTARRIQQALASGGGAYTESGVLG